MPTKKPVRKRNTSSRSIEGEEALIATDWLLFNLSRSGTAKHGL
jgi:hypothetical protein